MQRAGRARHRLSRGTAARPRRGAARGPPLHLRGLPQLRRPDAETIDALGHLPEEPLAPEVRARSCSRRSTAGGASSDVTSRHPGETQSGCPRSASPTCCWSPLGSRRRSCSLAPRVRLPSIVLEIVAGIVIGPAVLGWVEVDEPIEVLNLIGPVPALPRWARNRLRAPGRDGWFDFRRWGTSSRSRSRSPCVSRSRRAT